MEGSDPSHEKTSGLLHQMQVHDMKGKYVQDVRSREA